MTTVTRRARPSWTGNSGIPHEEVVELVGVVEVVVGHSHGGCGDRF